MNTHRKTAIIVGVLFILAIVTLFIGEAFYRPILDSPDYLDKAFPNEITVIIGILIEFIGYLGLVLIPVLLFPIFRKHSESLAVGYVSFRLFEVVLLTVAQINKLSLIKLSMDFLKSSAADVSYFQAIGNRINSVIYWINSDGLIYLIVYIIGALILYYALYKSRLIPRFLPVWGFIAAAALLIGTLLSTFGDISRALTILLVAPIALNELALSIWLIVKGFNPAAIKE